MYQRAQCQDTVVPVALRALTRSPRERKTISCDLAQFNWRLLAAAHDLTCYRPGRCPVCHVGVCYCGQTVEWIKMPLATEVGLVPDHIVLDCDPAPQGKGYSGSPLSRFTDRDPCLIVVKRSPISATGLVWLPAYC